MSRNKSFDFRERLESIYSASKTKNFLLKNSTFFSLLRVLSSHQFGSGSNPSVDAVCVLNLLLVLYFSPRGFFSPCTPVLLTPQKSTFPNSNSTRNGRRRTTSRMCCLPRYLFIYLFIYCCCFSYRAPVKWIAPSVVTMKCVFQTTKITVYDVFVRLDIQEHLAVSNIKDMAIS